MQRSSILKGPNKNKVSTYSEKQKRFIHQINYFHEIGLNHEEFLVGSLDVFFIHIEVVVDQVEKIQIKIERNWL